MKDIVKKYTGIDFDAFSGDFEAAKQAVDQGGKGIIQASLDSGAFDRFILSDRMINQSLLDTFGNNLKKSSGCQ